jgi:GNAT superfamily N-acetyltransferase
MLTIRRLQPGEAALYREVRLAALRESPEAFATRHEEAAARSEESWRVQADGSATGRDRATFVALDEGPVGLAALYRDEAAPETGELLQMWVAPVVRGGTVAAGLIGEVSQWAAANGFSHIRAEVMAGNARALGFYRKCGFEPAEGGGGSTVILIRQV